MLVWLVIFYARNGRENVCCIYRSKKGADAWVAQHHPTEPGSYVVEEWLVQF